MSVTIMTPEATPHDETAPVCKRSRPAMGDEGVLVRCWQPSGPIAGMARSYTGARSSHCFLQACATHPPGEPENDTKPLFHLRPLW